MAEKPDDPHSRPTAHSNDDVPIIHTCCRIGLQASPPRPRLPVWWRRRG